MKRATSVALLAGVMAGALCLTLPVEAAKKVKLRWWVTANYTWKTLEDRFEKAHPNIDVTIIDGDMDKFYTMIASGLMRTYGESSTRQGLQPTSLGDRSPTLDLTSSVMARP